MKRRYSALCLGMILLCMTACGSNAELGGGRTENDSPLIEENDKTEFQDLELSEGTEENKVGERKEIYSYFDLNYNNTSDLSFLDNRLNQAEIILIGEMHGIKSNMDIEMKFLHYLKEQYDLKYYLCEYPYSVSLKVNEYLESGNQKILDDFFEVAKDTNANTEERYEGWLQLYEYNQSLPEKDRIRVVGVEVELIPEYAMDVLQGLIPEKQVPAELEKMLTLMRREKHSKEEIEEIWKEFEEKKEICEEFFGEKTFSIQHILKNILLGYAEHEAETETGKYSIRDQGMYDNFMILHEQNEEGKYFGQFGNRHIYQTETEGVNWFASLLKQGGFEDKVVSIFLEYINCTRVVPNKSGGTYTEQTGTETSADLEQDILQNLSKDKLVIYSAVEEESPYHDVIDYVQYIIIVKDSEGVTLRID